MLCLKALIEWNVIFVKSRKKPESLHQKHGFGYNNFMLICGIFGMTTYISHSNVV